MLCGYSLLELWTAIFSVGLCEFMCFGKTSPLVLLQCISLANQRDDVLILTGDQGERRSGYRLAPVANNRAFGLNPGCPRGCGVARKRNQGDYSHGPTTLAYTGVEPMSVRWHKYSDPNAAAEACARHTLGLFTEMLSGQDSISFAVSGGTTPALYFDALAAAKFKWDRVHLFFVDERAVPPDHADSNYRLAQEHLLKKTRMLPRQVHRIPGEMEPHEAAAAYIDDIRTFFNLTPGHLPHFDIIHQGMGPDAHTASLFPGDPHIEDRDGVAAAVYVEKKQMWRVTLLPGVLLAAKHNIYLVTGEDKAESVRAVMDEPYDALKYPAQLVSHHGRSVAWFLDTAAANLID